MANSQSFTPSHYEADQPINLLEYWSIVVKRRWTVAFFFAALVAGITIATLRMERVYQAVATIIIEMNPPQVLQNVQEVVEVGAGSYWSNKEYYETQYKVIQSRTVAEVVVKRLGLDRDLHFLGIDKLPEEERGRIPQILQSADPARMLLARLEVEPVKDSRMVKIKVSGTDPAQAAKLCNAVADAYIEYNLDVKFSTTRDAIDWLSDQLGDLRVKLESSEMALYNFRRENDILATSFEDRQSINSQNIMNVNNAVSQVRTRRIELEAKRKKIEQLRSDGNFRDVMENITQNPLIQNLKSTHIELSKQYEDLSQRYQDEHPKVIVIRAQLELVEENINREVDKILQGIEADYDTVVGTERGLSKELEREKVTALAINKLEIGYKKLRREEETYRRLYELVLTRLKEADLTKVNRTNNIRKLDSALVPASPVKPRVKTNVLMAIVLGLLGGVGLAFFFEYMDNTVKSQEDIERVVGLPFLGIVPTISEKTSRHGHYYGRRLEQQQAEQAEQAEHPFNKDLYVHQHPKSSAAEYLRTIRTNLLFMSPEKPLSLFLITSAGPREGKTSTAISLGITMAQAGSRTILLDTDMRRPRIHRAFGLSNDSGISTLVLGEGVFEEECHETEVPNLYVMPCGPIPPNPNELISTERFKAIIEAARKRFERLILDSPPLAAVADALVLGNVADGAIIVAKCGETTKEMLLQARRQLQDVNAHVLGVIINDMDIESRKYSYRYYNYYRRYGYYYGGKAQAQS